MRKLIIQVTKKELNVLIKALRKYIRETQSREDYPCGDELESENLLTFFESIRE